MRQTGSQSFHDGHNLMPRHQGQPGRRHLSLDDVQVSVAHAAAAYPQQDFAGLRLWDRHLLPVQGVSGFQQDARTTTQALWYKFEVTGTSAGREWASVGVLVSGDVRYHIAVCAKPLQQWRSGQKQCDEVIRTFQPGNLNR